ncbi:hypothetical protein OsJ_09528 [Oryza sativa Japonica Group]|uniref:Uncharacterized protein n=1 Tax=Oryza sativa subsp. japonica TaxID=39947 RepID=B9FBH4_ORYSJ|nr:hypothetical protein OsJ_09528 [Oryza sativa Japonica Group]
MVTSKKVQNNEAAMADGAVKEYRHGLCMDVPMYIEDSEYCGEELGTRLTCRHGLTPKRRTAWEGPDTGRRFLGCPLEEEDQCDKFFWVDEPWHPRVQKTLEQMWHAVERATKLTDNNTSTARRRNPGKRGRHGRKLPILSVKPRELTIASSPHKFVTMVRSLNPLQTAAMEKIGFGGLLAMPEININRCWYWEHVKAVNSEFCNINYNGRQIPLISFWNAANVRLRNKYDCRTAEGGGLIIEQIEHPDFLNDEQRYEHDTHGFEDRENDFYINEQRIEEDTAFEELENDYPILSDNEEIDAQQSFAYANDHMPYGTDNEKEKDDDRELNQCEDDHETKIKSPAKIAAVEHSGHIKVLVDMLQQLERSIQFMENKLTNKLLSVEQICRKNTLAIEDETNLAKEIDGNGTEEAPFIITGDEATETDDNNKTIAERLRGSANLGLTLKDKITINYILQSEKTKVIEAYTELINDNQQGHTRQYGSALIEKETQVQVFLPINRDKSHWYVIVINARCQEIQILDSMQMQPQWYNASEDIKNLINGVAKYIDYTVKERPVPTSWTDTNVAKWPLCPKSVPQQKDSWSCGLNALKFMETWDGKELTSDFLNMEPNEVFRLKVAANLINTTLNIVLAVHDDIRRLHSENSSTSEVTMKL